MLGPVTSPGYDEPADDGPRLTVSAVARRLGIAPPTLRTWDRRYGVGPTEHISGAHRRYSPADLARLEVMRRLVMSGVPAGEAARVAKLPLTEGADRAAGGQDQPPVFPDRTGRLAAREPSPAKHLLGAEETVRGLIRAAGALDGDAVSTTASQQLARHGVLAAWESVLLPVQVAVGSRWAATGEGVEVEHLFSDCVSGALRQHALRYAPAQPARPVLLACAPGDLHVLPLHALAAGLAEQGTATRVLGAAVPADALRAAVQRTGPAALFLWSQTSATNDPGTIAQLPVTRPPTAVIAGGPGWDPEELPGRVTVAADFPAAVALVGQAVEAAGR